jgi:hypothetical protein
MSTLNISKQDFVENRNINRVEIALNTEKSMARYLEIYQSLYKRAPSELRDLGEQWVLVNGARMTVQELNDLTDQLQRELQQEQARKRNLVKRLLTWFSN